MSDIVEQEWMQDAQVAKRYGVSLMTLYRWDRAGIGFPPPTKIRNKNYRHLPTLREWDDQLKQRGIAAALARKEA